jgi:hypothetical protein
MKVKELIELLVECDNELDIVTPDYQDVISVKEEKVVTFRNGVKNSTQQVILGLSEDF